MAGTPQMGVRWEVEAGSEGWGTGHLRSVARSGTMLAMSIISESVRAFLATGPLAHVVTLDPDGSAHVSLAWIEVQGDELAWATFFDQRKIANLRRDPRITISFEAPASGGEVLHPYLVLQGRVRLEEGGALALMDRLSPTYIPPATEFPFRDMPPGITVRVSVERVYGQGPWKRDEGSTAG
jgi:PPOX class probable F420-dependent enzyme